jgi:hypothetical protein
MDPENGEEDQRASVTRHGRRSNIGTLTAWTCESFFYVFPVIKRFCQYKVLPFQHRVLCVSMCRICRKRGLEPCCLRGRSTWCMLILWGPGGHKIDSPLGSSSEGLHSIALRLSRGMLNITAFDPSYLIDPSPLGFFSAFSASRAGHRPMSIITGFELL